MSEGDLREVVRNEWEEAAPGWARWEATFAEWMRPATEAMLEMAAISEGDSVLDLACGTGIQTLRAAERVGRNGRVVANDIAPTMLEHVRERARGAGFENIGVLVGAAEGIEVAQESFDACVCHLGLMLLLAPGDALRVAYGALRPGGRMAAVVFTVPSSNPFMAKPMEILLRRTGKAPPAPGEPGIFALGAPRALHRLLERCGFTGIEERTLSVPLRLESPTRALAMMQDAFGAYRSLLSDRSDAERAEAWDEVREFLQTFERRGEFVAPAEVVVAAGARPGR